MIPNDLKLGDTVRKNLDPNAPRQLKKPVQPVHTKLAANSRSGAKAAMRRAVSASVTSRTVSGGTNFGAW